MIPTLGHSEYRHDFRAISSENNLQLYTQGEAETGLVEELDQSLTQFDLSSENQSLVQEIWGPEWAAGEDDTDQWSAGEIKQILAGNEAEMAGNKNNKMAAAAAPVVYQLPVFTPPDYHDFYDSVQKWNARELKSLSV